MGCVVVKGYWLLDCERCWTLQQGNAFGLDSIGELPDLFGRVQDLRLQGDHKDCIVVHRGCCFTDEVTGRKW